MTLDEQIAWLEQQACDDLLHSKKHKRFAHFYGRPDVLEKATARGERAAMLLTIENTLRALRYEAR